MAMNSPLANIYVRRSEFSFQDAMEIKANLDIFYYKKHEDIVFDADDLSREW